MKTKQFVLWQAKKWLPIFIVAALIIGVFCRSSIVLLDESTLSIFSLLAFVLPIWLFVDRFDKHAADAYRAFPANKLEIKRIKILIMIAYIVALITLTYIIGIIFYYFKYGNQNSTDQIYHPYDLYGMIDAGFFSFVFSYFMLLVFTLSTFLFNCTLFSLGNCLLTSILFVSFGSLLMTATMPAFILTFASKEYLVEYANDLGHGCIVGLGGTYGKQIAIQALLDEMFELPPFRSFHFNTAATVCMIILTIIEIGVGVLSFFLKDPSGEHYSMPGARDERFKIIPYASFVISFMFVAFLSALLGGISTEYFGVYIIVMFVLTAISCYISMALFNKRFTLTKKELIVMGSIIGFGIIVTLVTFLRIAPWIKEITYVDSNVQTFSSIL